MSRDRGELPGYVTLDGVTLTPRELEAFRLRVLGFNMTEVAATMGIAHSVVGDFYANINWKLDVATGKTGYLHSREIIAREAALQGLITFDDIPNDIRLTKAQAKITTFVYRGETDLVRLGRLTSYAPTTVSYMLAGIRKIFGMETGRGSGSQSLELIARIACWAKSFESK